MQIKVTNFVSISQICTFAAWFSNEPPPYIWQKYLKLLHLLTP